VEVSPSITSTMERRITRSHDERPSPTLPRVMRTSSRSKDHGEEAESTTHIEASITKSHTRTPQVVEEVALPSMRRRTTTTRRHRADADAGADAGAGADEGKEVAEEVPTTKVSIMRTRSQDDDTEDEDRNTATDDHSTTCLLRKSTRQVVLAKQPQPTFNFVHRLLLEPTLARQAKKRKKREREQEKRRSKKRMPTENPIRNKDQVDQLDKAKQRNASRFTYTRTSLLQDFGIKPRPVITGLKKVAPIPPKDSVAIAVPSGVARVAKAPKRKMSAMTPNSSLSSCNRHATFRDYKEDEEEDSSIPESAKGLIAQADMARRKKKKGKKHHKSLSSGSMDANEKHTLKHTPPNPAKDMKAPFVTPPSASLDHRQGQSQDSDDDEIEVVGVRPAAAPPEPTAHLGALPRGAGLPTESTRYSQPMARNVSQMVDAAVAAARQDRKALIRPRQQALNFLLTQNGVSGIYAGIAVVNDLYHLEAPPAAVTRLLVHNQAMGIMSLTKILAEIFTRPRFSGGLAYSIVEARLLAKRVIDCITPTLLGNTVISADQVMGIGLTWPETLLVLPLLQKIAEAVRRKFLALSKRLLALGSDDDSSLVDPSRQLLGSTNRNQAASFPLPLLY
jgi:hypothetical protein